MSETAISANDLGYDEEVTVDTAFARCGSHMFAGIKLNPSAQKIAAAYAMGMIFPYIPDDRKLFVSEGRYVYSQMFSDVVFLIYFCASSDDIADMAFHPRNHSGVRKMAFKWADEKGIKPGSDQYSHATNCFQAIMQDIEVSTSEPLETKDGKTEGTAIPN